MTNKLLRHGQKFNIYAVVLKRGESLECPAESFIDQMSEASRKSMLNVLDRHANAGPIKSPQKSRLLADGIFEFKSPQGDRLLWFYPRGRTGEVVITHGFHKGARFSVELQRARRLRDQYLQEMS